MTGPTAAKGPFPYAHRTVAQIDAAEAAFDKAEADERTARIADWDKVVGISRDLAQSFKRGATRTTLPSTPCPCCGARGWCGHFGRIAA